MRKLKSYVWEEKVHQPEPEWKPSRYPKDPTLRSWQRIAIIPAAKTSIALNLQVLGWQRSSRTAKNERNPGRWPGEVGGRVDMDGGNGSTGTGSGPGKFPLRSWTIRGYACTMNRTVPRKHHTDAHRRSQPPVGTQALSTPWGGMSAPGGNGKKSSTGTPRSP